MIKISGKIKSIFESETFGNFEKRVMWLEEVSDKYPSTWQLELWQTDCPMADSYNVGDYVTCYIDIKGKAYTNQKTGNEAVMNTLKCWNIEKDGKTYKEIKKLMRTWMRDRFSPKEPIETAPHIVYDMSIEDVSQRKLKSRYFNNAVEVAAYLGVRVTSIFNNRTAGKYVKGIDGRTYVIRKIENNNSLGK